MGIGTALIAVDTVVGKPFAYFNGQGAMSIPLLVLNGLWPALSILIYLISQIVLLHKVLGLRKEVGKS